MSVTGLEQLSKIHLKSVLNLKPAVIIALVLISNWINSPLLSWVMVYFEDLTS